MSKFDKLRARVRHEEGSHFRDHLSEARAFRLRVLTSVLFLCLMVGVLTYRFYHLQISNYQSYVTQSDRNRLQVRPIPPKRGLFFDARGRVVADNRAVSTLNLTIERVRDLDATIARIGEILPLSDSEIESFKKSINWRRRPYQSVPLKFDLSDEELARIAVNEYAIEGLSVEGQLVRNYPYGPLLTHTLGYVGRINEAELSRFDNDDLARYAGTDSIGKIGLEREYESILLGQPGQETIETDARGRVLRVVDEVSPKAGSDVHLFLDLDVQQKAEALMAGRRGAVVALDVASGGVLALVSTPSYDPNPFVTGISSSAYRLLNQSRDLPLFNRTIQGQYPPGSTVKPMLGLGGLKYRLISPDTKIFDPGVYQLENDERVYRDWKKGGHGGRVDLHRAIVESCDIFFYDLGFRMGVDRMHTFGDQFGMGQRSGIDIPNESTGLWPSREWKRTVRDQAWYPGNSLNMSIGQGDVLATPLQLAAMTATIARRGEYIEPRLAARIAGEATEAHIRGRVEVEPEYWSLVMESMRDVVHSARGTALVVGRGMRFEMAGKTGTAQVVGIAQDEEYDSEALAERHRDHALFVGFAPYENPQIAIAVVIENGEKSSKAGAVARDVIAEYLRVKHGG